MIRPSTLLASWVLCYGVAVHAASHAAADKAPSFFPRNGTAIEIHGNKFFTQTGDQFFIKGIAYQPARKDGEIYDNVLEALYLDAMANTTTCLRDLEMFKQLGVNVIRAYQFLPSANHDICMEAYAKEGIYILADLSEPDLSINRQIPTWDIELYDRYVSVVDALHGYDNVLGFFAGNEVTNSPENTDASPFVKAAVRDIKKYIKDQGYRRIPVGYATNDDAVIRSSLANYFVCDNVSSAIDFLGLNMYEWCGYSSYATSGYRERTVEFSNFPVPAFFSEYGCNTVNPRPFTEVEALYGSTMSKVWSGGIAYEYFEQANHYGLVKENRDGTVGLLQDYKNLQRKLKLINPKGPKGPPLGNRSRSPIKCIQDENWKGSSNLPNTPDRAKCECLQSTFSCLVTPYINVNEQEFFNEVCSLVDCSEVLGDGELGQYGRFSDCSLRQRLSYALNKFYIESSRDSKACDFDGRAILITNSVDTDLDEVLLDGRTCKEAIGHPLNTTKVTHKTTATQKLPYLGFSPSRKVSTASSCIKSLGQILACIFILGGMTVISI